jgi:RNase P protein component
MIPRSRRIPRGEFSSLRNRPFRALSGNWYTVRLYPGKSEKPCISVVISAKVAGGVRRNEARRAIYDATANLAGNYDKIVVYVRSLPRGAVFNPVLISDHIRREIL